MREVGRIELGRGRTLRSRTSTRLGFEFAGSVSASITGPLRSTPSTLAARRLRHKGGTRRQLNSRSPAVFRIHPDVASCLCRVGFAAWSSVVSATSYGRSAWTSSPRRASQPSRRDCGSGRATEASRICAAFTCRERAVTTRSIARLRRRESPSVNGRASHGSRLRASPDGPGVSARFGLGRVGGSLVERC